jgi:hypothetical protein
MGNDPHSVHKTPFFFARQAASLKFIGHARCDETDLGLRAGTCLESSRMVPAKSPSKLI